MKTTDVVRMLLTVLLVLGGGSTSLEAAQAFPGSSLRVLQSDEREIVLELTVTNFQMRPTEYDGQKLHRLIIPGMVHTARPGEPEAPTRGILLGLPSAAGVSVQVLDAKYETLRGYRLLPPSKPQVRADVVDNLLGEAVQPIFAFAKERHAQDAASPYAPVKIGQTGYMRDQAVAQVQFYPVHYDPISGEVRLYRRVLARVTWDVPLRASTATTRRAISPAYEQLLSKMLLNYRALQRPSTADLAPAVRIATGEKVGAASGMPAVKIGVAENGLYMLTYDNLIGAGFDLSGVDPRTITISNRGAEIPIYVQGEADGIFDPTDYVLFYGVAITDIYTRKNVYWLSAGGIAGRRMSIRDGGLTGSAPVPPHFPATLHAEQDTYYWQTIPNGAGQDHWFWDDKLTAPASRDHILPLQHISTSAETATLRVRLKGRTDVPNSNPDHHTKIFLNGFAIDDQFWDGQIIYDHAVAVPHAYLRNGDNAVTVQTVGDTGAVVDQVFVDWIEIEYWDRYVAEADELRFRAPAAGAYQFAVSGFSGSGVTVVDVTDPASAALIANTTAIADGSAYTLIFEDAAQPETRYLASTPARYKSPSSLEFDQPSSWKSASNGADYIIITHEDFYTSALRLAAHRSAAGLRVVTIKVGDLYDEFNSGIFHPQAIRDFLAYAYQNWVAPAPTYVLLLGDATQDYKDHLQSGTLNYVPSQIVQTDILGETPSDNWFVLVSGADILPDMFIGRLTAQTVVEAEAMVDKILQYEQYPPGGSWNTQVLLVADDDEVAFETISEELASLLPQGYTANRVYAGHYPPGEPTTDIAGYINGGSLLVNYTGHGSVDMWGLWNGSEPILDRSDITALANTSKLPVVTVADCLNGFFTGPKTQVSVAEELLRLPDSGAVSIWAPTSLGFSAGHRVLIGEFYKAMFQGGQFGLGAATTTAKLATYAQSSFWGEMIETYVLFGDPATPLGVPLGPITQQRAR